MMKSQWAGDCKTLGKALKRGRHAIAFLGLMSRQEDLALCDEAERSLERLTERLLNSISVEQPTLMETANE